MRIFQKEQSGETAGVPSEHRQKDALKDLYLSVRGTNFQVQVWRALLRIPEGSTVSYRQLADKIGRPTAVRAVANAVAENPVNYIIPCHRVIRSDGRIGGYRGGEVRKEILLYREFRQKSIDRALS